MRKLLRIISNKPLLYVSRFIGILWGTEGAAHKETSEVNGGVGQLTDAPPL